MADVGLVVDEIIENPLPHMIFAWSSRDPMERMILSCLAAMSDQPGKFIDIKDLEAYPGEEGLGFSFEPNRLREAAERLFSQDLLIKEASGAAFGFKMDLWRQWVRRMHSTWQVQDEISGKKNLADLGILPAKKSAGRKSWAPRIVGAVLAVALGLTFMWWGDRQDNEQGGVGVDVATPVAVAADSGWVEITASPSGSLVTANGQVIGFADGNRLRLPAGTTHLEMSHDQHRTWRETVPVGVDSVTTLEVELARETGAVKVVSHPAGAAIHLDGQPTGRRTPAVLTDLPVRDGYRIELRGDGLVSWASPAFSVAVDDTYLIDHDLAAASYPLSIATTPSNAEITLGGQAVGHSPAQLADLPAGDPPGGGASGRT